MNSVRAHHRILVAVALIATAACASGRKYRDPNMDFGAVKSVAVLPFANLTRETGASERVRDVLGNALLASGAVYVLPQGEVARGPGRVGVANPSAPSIEEVVKLGQTLKVDAVVTGVVKEYGEVRSGSAASNVCAFSVQLLETATGRVVWAASTTRGGIGLADRLFGGGGAPLNGVTEAAVDDVVAKLVK
jgi:polysaccharide biosynthesis protein PelC